MSTQIDAQMHKQTQTKANSHMRTHTHKKKNKQAIRQATEQKRRLYIRPAKQASKTHTARTVPP